VRGSHGVWVEEGGELKGIGRGCGVVGRFGIWRAG